MSEAKTSIIRSGAGCLSTGALTTRLRKERVRVIGLDCNPMSAGLHLADTGYVVPRGDEPGFLDEVVRICETEKPDAMISGPEEELLVLSKNKDMLEERGVLLLCPDFDTVKVCADKLETHHKLSSYAVPTPRIYQIEEAKFPCIIKPRFGRGGRDIYKANDREELAFFLPKVSQPVVQEFVEGTEYTVDVFADLAGNPLSIVPRVRLQVESGISVKGVTVFDEEIISYCRQIAESLKLIGPSCIQCLKTDERLVFIEINTRFGGGSALSMEADPTIVPNLVRMARREPPVPSRGFKQGLVMLRYYNEVFTTQDTAATGKTR